MLIAYCKVYRTSTSAFKLVPSKPLFYNATLSNYREFMASPDIFTTEMKQRKSVKQPKTTSVTNDEAEVWKTLNARDNNYDRLATRTQSAD